MGLKPTFASFFFALSLSAHADYALFKSKQEIVCTGEDNLEIRLNESRSAIQVTVEGESLGWKRVLKYTDNGKTKASLTTSQGTLTLSKRGDRFRYKGETTATELDCERI